MSKKSNLKADMYSVELKLKGAFKTRENRRSTINIFVEYIYSSGQTLIDLQHLKLNQVQGFIQQMQGRVKERTLENYISTIRVLTKGIGRIQFANTQLSNKSLGIKRGGREGTKLAIPEDFLEEELKKIKIKSPEIEVLLRLQIYLGLRSLESIRCAKSLKQWQHEIQSFLSENSKGNEMLEIVFGTKGGRGRAFLVKDIPSIDNALLAITDALKICKGKNIIKNKTLKSAMGRYRYVISKSKLKGEYSPHSLRYRFAVEFTKKQLDKGIPVKIAIAKTSLALGHGDGRGEWVKRVYHREKCPLSGDIIRILDLVKSK